MLKDKTNVAKLKKKEDVAVDMVFAYALILWKITKNEKNEFL